jgi:prepilin peptidase CpaA
MTATIALWLVTAIVFDFRKRKVPNALVIGGLALTLAALAFDLNTFASGNSDALIGGATAFLVLLIFYSLGAVGAGDVKFAAVVGLWMGFHSLLILWIVASILAGLHSALWLILQRWPVMPSVSAALMGSADTHPSGKLRKIKNTPYAAYIAIAALAKMTQLI